MNASNNPGARSGEPVWLYVTNQLNLMMILAAGMLMPREGFGDKYYRDLLVSYSGWIPLFPNAVPQTMVKQVVEEARYLRPVALELDVHCIQGPAKVVTIFGAMQEITLPEELPDRAGMLFVPPPLPLALAGKIHFVSAKDKKDFVDRAGEHYRNVPETWLDKATTKNRFTGKSSPAANLNVDCTVPPGLLARAQAMGGILALLFHLANRSELGRLYYQWLTGTVDDVPELDPLLAFFPAWICREQAFPPESLQVKLFWTLVDKIISAQAGDFSRDVVLEAMGREILQLNETAGARYQEKLQHLRRDLEALRGLSDDTLDDLFKRHTRPFSRALVLFFLLNRARDLLEFEHEKLEPADLLAAAVLFGAREGWINLAVDLRHSRGFADEVSTRMADACHRGTNAGLRFSMPAPQTLPLRALLGGVAESRRREKQVDEAMLAIARRQKWDCVETTIRLPKGEYRLLVEPSGTRLILDGDVKSVQARVRREPFWDRLSRLPLPVPEELEKIARRIVK